MHPSRYYHVLTIVSLRNKIEQSIALTAATAILGAIDETASVARSNRGDPLSADKR